MDTHQVEQTFKTLYKTMRRDHVSRTMLADCYHADIEFKDPFHHIRGIHALTDYFTGLYENVTAIDFQFLQTWQSGDSITINWIMEYRHPRIASGNVVSVDGISELRIRDNRIVYHRDYFDAGQMLYEQLPLLSSAISWLKRRMSA
ncbi:transcriptional regulator [Bacterioplanes sanyensis]|uniref:Transcriptional regulator n=1 Tax=Bacterioplanes sanyensis TaxID=1249553 RepID=A0A222FJS8_9GAMM|nr:nuclear transport factor 2 family protein [Bacterioplanes sanyensis]ASP38671.1 transcriptional regulator [Bacterioplanes sanyensis]